MSSSDSEGSEVEGTDALQIALREKEEALVQSALKRIRRAQEKGKSEVKLNKDELDALENRRKRMQAAATTKARKESGSNNGSGNEKRRRSERNIVMQLAPQKNHIRSDSRPSSGSRRSSKGKGKSKRVDEVPSNSASPAFMVAGADGVMYAPSSQQTSPNQNPTSRSRASTNSQPTRGSPTLYYPYQAGNPRYAPDNARPGSSASNRSPLPMPDEEGWVPTNSRLSSGASSYVVDPFDYQVSSDTVPPIPTQYMQPQSQPGRRAVSGQQEVSYSSVRRSLPPGASYQQSQPHTRGPIGDEFQYRQRPERDELAQDYYSSSEDISDDLGNGVQVFVDERETEKVRAAVPRKPVGGGKKNRKR